MTPVVWANIALAIPFLIAFIAVPLWLTFRWSFQGPDHANARAYLSYKAALTAPQASRQPSHRVAA